MGKVPFGLAVTLFILFAATNSSAALVTDDGALTIGGPDKNSFTTSPAGSPGGFPDGNYVFGMLEGYINATLSFNLNQDYLFEYMGKEAADTNTFSFTSGSYSSFNTGSSISGDSIVVSPTDSPSWVFDGNNSLQASSPSEYIFMAVEGNSVWLGFDDRQGGHVDYDDLVVRVSAVNAVPVPAAIWLFGSALVGFAGMSRKTKV